jgi:hypothetical protein
MPEMSTDAIYARVVMWTAIYTYLPGVYSGQPFFLANIAVHFPCGVFCPTFLSGVYCCAPNHSRIHCSLCTSLAYIANYLPLRGRRMAIYARDVDRLQFMPEWLCGQQYTPTSDTFRDLAPVSRTGVSQNSLFATF